MKGMRRIEMFLIWFSILAMGFPVFAQGRIIPGKNGPGWKELLRQADQAPSAEKTRLLTAAVRSYTAGEVTDTEARNRFQGEFLRLVKDLGPTPETLRGILGTGMERTVSRQLFYQRYLERWLVVWPVQFRVVFDCRRGKDPVLMDIRPGRE